MRVGDGSFIVDASRRGGMNPLTRGGQGLQCRSAVTPPHNRREFNGRCCVIQSPASEWPWMVCRCSETGGEFGECEADTVV